ncbi:MAG: cytochrome c [Puniceicoccaceae bacterium]
MKKYLIPLSLLTLGLGASSVIQAQDLEFDLDRTWKKNCRKCHAADGSGSTPAGKKLKVKDYTKAEDQALFTDEEAMVAIRDGVMGPDGKSVMDAYPDYSEAQLQALVELVRSFAKASE